MRAIELLEKFGPSPSNRILWVRVASQELCLYESDACIACWPVSSASNGVGCTEDSYQTPLGMHRIAEKIGSQSPPGTVFRGRELTGEIAQISLDPDDDCDDLITSRILWLEGLEPGINRGENVDSYRRYIYIHGTPEEGRIGQPASRGCIRMRNHDIITLFELVEPGTLVYIDPGQTSDTEMV